MVCVHVGGLVSLETDGVCVWGGCCVCMEGDETDGEWGVGFSRKNGCEPSLRFMTENTVLPHD